MTTQQRLAELGLLTHSDIVSAGSEENVRWTVEGFMREGAYAMISGASKIGKTALITHLAYCVAEGKPFLGMAVRQAPVLWLAYEEPAYERALLCHRYPDSPIYTVDRPANKIDTPEGIEDLRRRIALIQELEGRKVGLVVVDTLTPATSQENLSEPVNARRAVQPLNDLRGELGISVLLVHHNRKGGGAKGDQNKIADSHQLQAAVGQFWVMEVEKGSPRAIQLHGCGRGREANRVWHVRSSDEWTFELVDEDVAAEAKRSARSAQERFLDVLRASGTSMTSAKIAAAIKENRRYFQNVATELLEAGKIKPDGKASKSTLWALVG